MAKKIYFEDINIGDAMPTFTSDSLTRTHLVRYAGASGDFNPLHHDETFVAMFGMQRVIAHGMLIMGITSHAITEWIDNKCLKNFKVRFSGMTEPADLTDFENTKARATITITGKISEKICGRWGKPDTVRTSGCRCPGECKVDRQLYRRSSF